MQEHGFRRKGARSSRVARRARTDDIRAQFHRPAEIDDTRRTEDPDPIAIRGE
jgi:hypothetical protein